MRRYDGFNALFPETDMPPSDHPDTARVQLFRDKLAEADLTRYEIYASSQTKADIRDIARQEGLSTGVAAEALLKLGIAQYRQRQSRTPVAAQPAAQTALPPWPDLDVSAWRKPAQPDLSLASERGHAEAKPNTLGQPDLAPKRERQSGSTEPPAESARKPFDEGEASSPLCSPGARSALDEGSQPLSEDVLDVFLQRLQVAQTAFEIAREASASSTRPQAEPTSRKSRRGLSEQFKFMAGLNLDLAAYADRSRLNSRANKPEASAGQLPEQPQWPAAALNSANSSDAAAASVADAEANVSKAQRTQR